MTRPWPKEQLGRKGPLIAAGLFSMAAGAIPACTEEVAGRTPPATDAAVERPGVADARDQKPASTFADAFRFPEHAPSGCIPDCLWRLFTACAPPPTDSCQNQEHDGGVLVVCYSSGFRRVFRFSPPRTTTDYRPDGTICMTATGMGAVTTYRGGDGRVVAVTRNLDPLGETVEVECEGKKTVAEFSTPRCTLVSGACLPGTCPL